MKKLLKKLAPWALTAIGFMVVFQFAVSYAASNKKFEVVYSSETQIEGYEKSAAAVRVYASPAIKWDETSGAARLMGRVFWILILLAAWYVGTDRHKSGLNDRSIAKGVGILMAPVVLCAAFWFGGYSSSLDKGSMVKYYDEFVKEYQIDEETQAQILEHGSSGTNIKDKSGVLTMYFKGK